MYERFTDRARKVMQLANQEAQRFNHEYVGTEHILLALIKEGSGLAAAVCKNLDLDLRRVRLKVEELVQAGPDMVTMGKLPQTPRAKRVMEYAMEEARSLGHNHVGTEHILLGLIREGEGVAATVLKHFGIGVEIIREECLNLLGHGIQRLNEPSVGKLFKVRLPNKFGNLVIMAVATDREAALKAVVRDVGDWVMYLPVEAEEVPMDQHGVLCFFHENRVINHGVGQ